MKNLPSARVNVSDRDCTNLNLEEPKAYKVKILQLNYYDLAIVNFIASTVIVVHLSINTVDLLLNL